MNPLARKQFELNQTTRSDWAAFDGHRRRVTDLLAESVTGNGRLCILGAGNCNDIDLTRLGRIYEEIVLVDLDRDALVNGSLSQPLDVADRVKCLGDIDASGCLTRTATWSTDTQLQEADLVALATGANVREWPTVPHFDVVASTCLLSQLIGSLDHSLTSRHPQFIEAAQSIRAGHFRTIASLLRPGGHMVFVSDVVSSETCPELLANPDAHQDHANAPKVHDPAAWLVSVINRQRSNSGLESISDPDTHRIVAHAIKNGNFFTGLNPVVVHKLLKSDPEISPLFDDITFVPPWTWQCGRRSYAVYAIKARRTTAPLP